MQSCLCILRAECPSKKYLWAPRKAVCASPVCRQEITLGLPGKGQNPDVPSGSANEPWRLMRLVQGTLHPGSGVCTAKLWEKPIPSCPHQVREGPYLVGQIFVMGPACMLQWDYKLCVNLPFFHYFTSSTLHHVSGAQTGDQNESMQFAQPLGTTGWNPVLQANMQMR